MVAWRERTTRHFQRYVLSLQYNGQRFAGSSGHPSTMGANRSVLPSVQETMEVALQKFVGRKNFSDVQFSSRTDAGVHAFGNTLHVDIENRRRNEHEVIAPHEPTTVQRALNSILAPKGIGVTSVSAVPSTFHSRFDAKNRTYMYRILVLPRSPSSAGWRGCLFEQDTSLIVSPRKSTHFNVDMMRAAAHPLLGKHDFTSFRNSGCQAAHAIKTLDVLNIDERRWTASPLSKNAPFDFFRGSSFGINAHVQGSCGNLDKNKEQHEAATDTAAYVQEILITVRAKSFLYNQVRNIVGFLMDVGENPEMNKVDAARRAVDVLEQKDRNYAPKKAPASGLYLMHVEY